MSAEENSHQKSGGNLTDTPCRRPAFWGWAAGWVLGLRASGRIWESKGCEVRGTVGPRLARPPGPHLEGSGLAEPLACFAGLGILAVGFQVPTASWPGVRVVPGGGPQPKLNCPQMALGALVPLRF